MSFLHAGLIGLAGLFTVPLIIHLLNRRRYKRVQWAAMEFLLRAYKQNRRRLRLESLLLLILRCLIPVLLAFAVARPHIASDIGLDSGQGPHHIFVLDRSYSMGYSDQSGSRPFDRMKHIATSLIDRIAQQGNEKVSLVYMGIDVTTPVRGDLDVEKAQRALTRLEAPSDGRAELRAALEAAKQLVNEEPDPARIYVFSDFQQITLAGVERRAASGTGTGADTATGGTGTGTGDSEAANLFRVVRDMCQDLRDMSAEIVLFPLAPRGQTANTQVVSIELDPENVVANVGSTVRAVLVHRGPEVRDVLVKMRVDGSNEQTRRVRLRPDEPQDVAFHVRFLEEGMHAAEIEIDEDGLPVDDKRRIVTRVRDQIRVLLVEGRETAEEDQVLTNSFLYRYLLDPTGGEGSDVLRVFAVQVVDEDRFQTDTSFFQNQDVIAIMNVSALRPDVAKRVVDYVRNGGGLLLAPGPSAVADQYNAQLFGVDGEAGPLPLRLLRIGGFQGALGTGRGAVVPTTYATPKVVAEDHPLMVDFKSPELRTFLEVMPVYRYWSTSRIDAPEDTVIALDLAGTQGEDRPALLATRRFGRGECALLTSNISRRPDRWNRLDATDQIRFPLVHSLAHHLARQPKDSLNRLVGETLTTWVPARPAALYMTRPGDRGRVPLQLPKGERDAARRTSVWDTPPFEDTVHAGIYRLGVEFVEKTKTATEILFAVNPDPAEGVLAYVQPEALARELPGVDVREEGVPVEIGSAIEADTSELGRLLLLLALAVALGECILASFVGGRRK